MFARIAVQRLPALRAKRWDTLLAIQSVRCADIVRQAFYDLLDSKCSYFKQEGIAYFAHLIMESQGAGYGIIGNDGNLKFPFNPRTSC